MGLVLHYLLFSTEERDTERLSNSISFCRMGKQRPKECKCWASLVAQWLGVCLLVQGTRVRALVWEDPTCCGATRPVSHNY